MNLININVVGQPIMFNGKKVGTVKKIEVVDGGVEVKADIEEGFDTSLLTGEYTLSIPFEEGQ